MATDMVFCRGCGKQIHVSAPACPHCGFVQGAAASTKGTKNRGIAALLAFLVGGFGVHRFYLGQWWGVFYLLLVWTMIPGLISVIEAIVFLCTSDKSWDDKYNGGKNSGGASMVLVVVVLVVGVLGTVMVIGILAAVAIPAYQDYAQRAKIAMAYSELSSHKPAYEALVQKRDLGKRLEEAGVAIKVTPQSGLSGAYHDPSRQVLVGKVAGPPEGRTIGLRLNADGSWTCGSVDLAKKYLPPSCREDLSYASEEQAAKLRAEVK